MSSERNCSLRPSRRRRPASPLNSAQALRRWRRNFDRQGAYRPIRLLAPEGSVVNPKYPAAVTLCTTYPAHQIVHAIWKALGQAVPERACAGWSRASHCNTSGLDARGRFYVAYQWLGLSGAGAVKGRDGFETMGHMATLGGLTLPDVETFEVDYPFHVHRHELRLDGGGPGQFRGGTGALVELDVLLPAEYSYRGEGNETDGSARPEDSPATRARAASSCTMGSATSRRSMASSVTARFASRSHRPAGAASAIPAAGTPSKSGAMFRTASCPSLPHATATASRSIRDRTMPSMTKLRLRCAHADLLLEPRDRG